MSLWKANLGKVAHDVRFLFKLNEANQGAWHYVNQNLQFLKTINPATKFVTTPLPDNFPEQSACIISFKDEYATEILIPVENLTPEQFEAKLAEAVNRSSTLNLVKEENLEFTKIPEPIVENYKHAQYTDNLF